MAITGNYFYINTPLIDTIDLSVFPEQINRVGIEVKNDFKKTEVTLIPFNNEVTYNLNSIVKSVFVFPKANLDFSMETINQTLGLLTEVRYRYYYVNLENETEYFETILSYIFYRGGGINGVVRAPWATNGILSNSKKIPYFSGFPCATYKPALGSGLRQVPKHLATEQDIFEELPILGRNGAFLFYLNSMAGFSGWYFSNHEVTTDSSGGVYGYVFDELKDFGSDYARSMKVWGKVPTRYFGLMEDLIVSPLIYLCETTDIRNQYKWTRLVNEKNKITNSMKKAEYVELEFAIPHNDNVAIR